MKTSRSKYYKLALCDGLEAPDAMDHNTAFPFHYHPTFNISLVYNGVLPTRLNDQFVIAAPGTILITNPQEVHAFPCDKESSVSFFTLYVPPGLLSCAKQGNTVFFDENVIDDTALFAELHQLKLSIGDEKPVLDEAKLVGLLNQLTVRHGANSYEADNDLLTLFSEFLAEENFEKFSLPNALV